MAARSGVAGILLVIYASHNDDIPLVSVGAVLVSLPLIMLLVVIFLCFNQRRLAKLGKNKVTTAEKKTTATTTTTTTATTTTMTMSKRDESRNGAVVGFDRERY